MGQAKIWGAIYLAAAASIWGGMYVVSKVVLEVVPPLALVWLRYVLAVGVLAVAGRYGHISWRLPRKYWGLTALIGAVGYGISIWTQFLGTALSTAQMGSVITAATPAFMVIFAYFLLHERITPIKLASVIVATAGVWLIVGGSRAGVHGEMGGAILFVAALTWALMSVLVKMIPPEVSLLAVTTYALTLAMVAITPVALEQLRHIATRAFEPISIWGGILYLGFIATALAFFLWNQGLRRLDAGRAGVYFFFQPLMGSLLGWIVLGERVSLAFWAGAALIAAGVLLAIRPRVR